MIHLITAFTWIGAIACFCVALIALCWLLDKTVSMLLRTAGWLGPVVRFMRLDYQQKLAIKEAFEREQRKREDNS